MVKIGRWAEPYTESGNPFPDETDSFAAMPPSSPMQILPYGILSEMILPLIIVKRREKREQRKKFLIKKTLNVNLILCLRELYRLSKLYPRIAIISNLRGYQISNKKNMMKLIDDCEIPLIYLEETYQKQLQGPPKIEKGDWVKYAETWGDTWGVVEEVLRRKNIRVKMVQTKHCEYGKTYPVFHRWKRDYRGVIRKQVSIWNCEKVGHDTPEWIRLRVKMIEDYNKGLTKRKSIWNDKLLPIISHELAIDTSSGEARWAACRYRDYCKEIWFTMVINFLDKRIWKSIKENREDNSYLVRQHLYWCWRSSGYREAAPQGILRYLRNIVLRDGVLD
jgi:hypothetical protein